MDVEKSGLWGPAFSFSYVFWIRTTPQRCGEFSVSWGFTYPHNEQIEHSMRSRLSPDAEPAKFVGAVRPDLQLCNAA
jgi:hypothetical protein